MATGEFLFVKCEDGISSIYFSADIIPYKGSYNVEERMISGLKNSLLVPSMKFKTIISYLKYQSVTLAFM